MAGGSLEGGEASAEGDVEQWFLRKTKEGMMSGDEGVSEKFPTIYGKQLLQVVSTWNVSTDGDLPCTAPPLYLRYTPVGQQR